MSDGSPESPSSSVVVSPSTSLGPASFGSFRFVDATIDKVAPTELPTGIRAAAREVLG